MNRFQPLYVDAEQLAGDLAVRLDHVRSDGLVESELFPLRARAEALGERVDHAAQFNDWMRSELTRASALVASVLRYLRAIDRLMSPPELVVELERAGEDADAAVQWLERLEVRAFYADERRAVSSHDDDAPAKPRRAPWVTAAAAVFWFDRILAESPLLPKIEGVGRILIGARDVQRQARAVRELVAMRVGTGRLPSAEVAERAADECVSELESARGAFWPSARWAALDRARTELAAARDALYRTRRTAGREHESALADAARA